MIALNEQQSVALQEMEAFLKSDKKFFILVGFAGTGKTTCVQALINKLQKDNNRLYVAASAPTHKAVKVLQRMASSWGLHNVDFGTIYQFLGLKLEYDDEGGQQLREGRDSTIHKYELIILDEASMVSSSLWVLLQQSVKYKKTKFILLGDPAQLPPVNEPESPVFGAISNQVTLTQMMRQSRDNPISDIIDAARQRVFHHNRTLLLSSDFNKDRSNGVWVLDQDKWTENLIKAFKSPKYQDDPSFAMAIAWRNVTVDKLNCIIRDALYNNPKEPYVVGERLVAKDPVINLDDEIIITTSTPVQVLRAHSSTDGDYNIWRLKIVDDEGNQRRVMVLDHSSREPFNKNLRRLAAEARRIKHIGENAKPAWEKYWQHHNRYAAFGYAYASTTHKAQGDSIKNVFVAHGDILANPNPVEKWKALYVALSRATERLMINI